MPRIVKCGLIQASHACDTGEKLDIIREANIAKHMTLIERAGSEGVQILCMQEIFTGPYFCAEQSPTGPIWASTGRTISPTVRRDSGRNSTSAQATSVTRSSRPGMPM